MPSPAQSASSHTAAPGSTDARFFSALLLRRHSALKNASSTAFSMPQTELKRAAADDNWDFHLVVPGLC